MRVRGELLKEARLKKGLRLEEVSESIKIRPQYLYAIEEGLLEVLPPGIIAKGFVKAYARFLGVDPQEVILEEGQWPPPALLDVQEKSKPKRPWLMLGIALIGIGLLLAMWMGRERSPFYGSEGLPPQGFEMRLSEGTSGSETGLQSSALNQAQQDASQTSPGVQAEGVGKVYILELKAKELTWVRIRPKDKDSTYELLLQPGQTHVVESPLGFELKVGNAGGLDVLLNGQPLPPLGKSGQVRTLSLP